VGGGASDIRVAQDVDAAAFRDHFLALITAL